MKISSRKLEACSGSPLRMGKRVPALLAGLAALAIGASGASAGTLYNGWNYAIDSFDDGSGGELYEERGLAFRQIGTTGYFAISGGMPLTGVVSASARNGTIAPGDLYLNFSSHNLDTQAKFNDPEVFGIRFASANDSLANVNGNPLGLFKNLTVVNLAPANNGYATLQAYYNANYGRPSATMGDLSTTTDVINYFDKLAMYANIESGTWMSDITQLDQDALTGLGLNFGNFVGAAGPQIFGFSFDIDSLPRGQFTAHFFEECINDGIALKGTVPEPGTLALLGVALAGVTIRRRQDQRRAGRSKEA